MANEVKVIITGDDQTANSFQRAEANVKNFSSSGEHAFHGIESAETKAHIAAKLLESQLGIEVPRAFGKVISHSQLLGPALEMAFPAMAVVGFIGIAGQVPELIENITSEVYDLKSAEAQLEQQGRLNKHLEEVAEKARNVQKEIDKIGKNPAQQAAIELSYKQGDIEAQRQKLAAMQVREKELRAILERPMPLRNAELYEQQQREQAAAKLELYGGIGEKGKGVEALTTQILQLQKDIQVLGSKQITQAETELTQRQKEQAKQLSETAKETAAAMEVSAGRIRSIMAEVAGVNGDTAEKVRLQWQDKLKSVEAAFKKFPQLKMAFPDVLTETRAAAGFAEMTAYAKDMADQLEASAKAAREIAASASAMPNLTLGPAQMPVLNPDMKGALLDRFSADQTARNRMAEELMTQSLSKSQQYEVELAKINELLKEGLITQQAYDASKQKLDKEFGQGSFLVNLTSGLQQGFQGLFSSLTGTGHNAVQSFATDIAMLGAKMLELYAISKLMGWLFPGAGGGSMSGLVGSIGGGLSLPHFAAGGRNYGQPSWVGERGVELFWPDSAGTVIPNSELKGGSRNTPNVNVNVTNEGSAKDATVTQARWDEHMEQLHLNIHLKDQMNNGPLSRKG